MHASISASQSFSPQAKNCFSLLLSMRRTRAKILGQFLFFASENVISQSFSSLNVCEGCVYVPCATGNIAKASRSPSTVRMRADISSEIYTGTHTTPLYLHNEYAKDKKFETKYFLIRAVSTFIQFMVLGTCSAGDYTFSNGCCSTAHCMLSTRLVI